MQQRTLLSSCVAHAASHTFDIHGNYYRYNNLIMNTQSMFTKRSSPIASPPPNWEMICPWVCLLESLRRRYVGPQIEMTSSSTNTLGVSWGHMIMVILFGKKVMHVQIDHLHGLSTSAATSSVSSLSLSRCLVLRSMADSGFEEGGFRDGVR